MKGGIIASDQITQLVPDILKKKFNMSFFVEKS